ncbi:MAG: glycosyltransferase family 39 protein [Candidatus Sumerlaeota bacterium]|nr:glycosyltransferase family 39 protein [Candidatus Sumerlaeota bacterium]
MERISLRYWLIALSAGLLLRLALLAWIGPVNEIDTAYYKVLAKNLSDRGEFAVVDIVTGQWAPCTFRLPINLAFWASLYRIGLNGAAFDWTVAGIQAVLSVLTAFLTALACQEAFGARAARLALWLAVLDIWASFYACLLLTDTMFLLFVAVSLWAGARAVARPSRMNFALYGLTIGASMLVRPVFKFYWVCCAALAFALPVTRRRAAQMALAFMIAAAIPTVPWLIRNWAVARCLDFDTSQGTNILWSQIALLTPPLPEDYAAQPALARAQEIAYQVRAQGSFAALHEIRRQMNLSEVEADALLRKIGINLIRRRPFASLKLYAVNAVNLMTSPATMQTLAARITRDDSFEKVQIGEAWRRKAFIPLLLNVSVRAISFLLFCLGPLLGAYVAVRSKPTRIAALLYITAILYFIVITSFTAGYDRYRLPMHPFIWGLLAIGALKCYDIFCAKHRPLAI